MKKKVNWKLYKQLHVNESQDVSYELIDLVQQREIEEAVMRNSFKIGVTNGINNSTSDQSKTGSTRDRGDQQEHRQQDGNDQQGGSNSSHTVKGCS